MTRAAEAKGSKRASFKALLRAWYTTDVPDGRWSDDRKVLDWMERAQATIRDRLADVRRDAIVSAILAEAEKDKEATRHAALALAKSLSQAARDELIAKIKAL